MRRSLQSTANSYQTRDKINTIICRNLGNLRFGIGHRSMEFVSLVYKISSNYPKYEFYGLIDQIRRASVTIALNIAEGSGCESDKEFARFLVIARRSAYEVITAAEIAIKLGYGQEEENQKVIKEADEIVAMINGFIRKLKN